MSIETKSIRSSSTLNEDDFDDEEEMVAASLGYYEDDYEAAQVKQEAQRLVKEEVKEEDVCSNSSGPMSTASSSTQQQYGDENEELPYWMLMEEQSQEKQARQRRAFSHRQKLEILEKYDQLGSIRRTSIECNVSRKQIRNWLKMRNILKDSKPEELERSRVRGAGKKFDPRLEYRLATYVKRLSTGEVDEKLSYNAIRAKALSIAEQLEIDGFRASNGFIQRFCQRNNIAYKKNSTHTITKTIAAFTQAQ